MTPGRFHGERKGSSQQLWRKARQESTEHGEPGNQHLGSRCSLSVGCFLCNASGSGRASLSMVGMLFLDVWAPPTRHVFQVCGDFTIAQGIEISNMETTLHVPSSHMSGGLSMEVAGVPERHIHEPALDGTQNHPGLHVTPGATHLTFV